MTKQIHSVLCLCIAIFILASPVKAVRESDSYDGNIYALYAGNGSLVPPNTSLQESLQRNRTAVIIFYLDDSSTSKQFAPTVSEIQRFWNESIDILPITTDSLQDTFEGDTYNPSKYWRGLIPQIVIIGPKQNIMLDKVGQVPLSEINEAISLSTGLPAPNENSIKISKSFNEINVGISSD